MVYANLDLESKLWGQGYNLVCGIDEVGRGSFAGPVVAGAVVFSSGCEVPQGIADSKLLLSDKREELSSKIREKATGWSVGVISVLEINKFGIGRATQMAFRRAIANLLKRPDYFIIDAFYVKHLNRKKQKPVKNGDKLSVSIAAASIVAKVYRDGLMVELENTYPGYGFSKNKGYGTKEHQEAIGRLGLSQSHRTSFNLSKYVL